MANDNNIDLLTLEEAAKKLKVSMGTLRRWDNEGELKAVRIGTRRKIGDRRYRKKDIENYLKNKI
ncbi:helix-turn-helix domain-containing protein [Patescibacteria group bacterium]|nr:helix-turn-helix domain-containing protein [Patescibacteria group bacterium]MCG2702177.1 helix-turn-helix domain-containing protein [Candidatus Parcubacteria bacterium]MBU4265339.1 helix-turn-helix domain-containing protein [Patescibacteria group bacterium]MBU4390779.1 helix-turn-helix domain-containing protein [Patescibacteria group bacterium]MBU4396954.1 helix-turn-helix domain-containing protein [Patescibacteria group bacterium]